MRPSRIFRWVVRLFLLVCTLSLSAVGLLGGFSAVTILDPDSYNVNIPDGPITAVFDINNPSTLEITVPFNITNAGVYDLTDVTLKFELGMEYGDTTKNCGMRKSVCIYQVVRVVAHDILRTTLVLH